MRAKQVGIALLMYATDYDDEIRSDLDLNKDLSPYVVNNKMLEGFVYTFAGGNIYEVESPSTTVLGYIDTKHGRAIVYLDSHAEWVSKG